MKYGRKVLAKALIVMLLVPTVNVKATTNNNYEANTTEREAIKDNINKLPKDLIDAKYVTEEAKTFGMDIKDSIKFEREEFKLKAEAVENYKLLHNKTEDEFEVAIVKADGSYYFINSANTYDKAMDILGKTPLEMNDEPITPVIINKYGQVVYATNYMVRFLKNVNGIVHLSHNDECYEKSKEGNYILDKYGNKVIRKTHPSDLTNIYTNSNLSTAYTYINQNFVDDAPVIEETDKAVKVQVNGYTGWVNKNYNELYIDANGKNINYLWSDVVIVPIVTATNPNYYFIKDGMLKHSISYDLQAPLNSNNASITIGVAPSYLKEGSLYLSYDGNYFYEASNVQAALNLIVIDLKANNKNNSVNKDKPYYVYYQNLPFRSKTTYTANDLDRYINSNTDIKSKLRGMGQAFKTAEATYGINAMLMLGIAINESDRGMSTIAQTKNNIFGLKAYDSNTALADTFPTVEACIIDFAKNWISAGYADPANWRYYGGNVGNKNIGANVKYASDPFWGEKATQHAFLVDYYLSDNNINALKDYDAQQLVRYIGANRVIDTNNNLLYEVYGKVSDYGAFPGTVSVVADNNKKLINGEYYIEIYPERNTPVFINDVVTGFKGEYNWSNKGYILAKDIEYINVKKNSDIVEPDLKPIINAVDVTMKIGDVLIPSYIVSAVDKDGNDLTSKIVVTSNNVNDSKEGTYSITYKVVDKDGYEASKTITVVVKGALTIDEIYGNAYRATIKAVSDKTQKLITYARATIKKLPSNYYWAIGEFSKKLDEVQQPKLVNIVKAINNAKANPNQENVNKAKSLIEPELPDVWKKSYTSALDKVQQYLMDNAFAAVKKAEVDKTTSDIDLARLLLDDIKTAESKAIYEWAIKMEERLNSINIMN